MPLSRAHCSIFRQIRSAMFEKELFSFVDSVYSDIPESIRTTGKLDDDDEGKADKGNRGMQEQVPFRALTRKGGTEQWLPEI